MSEIVTGDGPESHYDACQHGQHERVDDILCQRNSYAQGQGDEDVNVDDQHGLDTVIIGFDER